MGVRGGGGRVLGRALGFPWEHSKQSPILNGRRVLWDRVSAYRNNQPPRTGGRWHTSSSNSSGST